MITDFPNHDQIENMPGIFTFEFIPERWVHFIPEIKKGRLLKPIVLVHGKTWLKGYSTEEKARFTEFGESEGNTKAWSHSFKGSLPKLDASKVALVDAMLKEKFYILKILDHNGNWRLLGNKEIPVMFRSNYDSGRTGSDYSGYEFEFYTGSRAQAPILTDLTTSNAFSTGFSTGFGGSQLQQTTIAQPGPPAQTPPNFNPGNLYQ